MNLPDTVGYSVPDEYARDDRAHGEGAGRYGGGQRALSRRSGPGGGEFAGGACTRARGRSSAPSTESANGPGNAALEEIVMAMNTRRDRLPFETRIVTEQLFPASQMLTSIITFGPQPNKAIVGENAFAHEAGIHQDGYLKERTTYEIIEPQTVGVPETRLVLGKHSGRHALAKRCDDLGIPLQRASSSISCTSASRRSRIGRRVCATTRSRSWRARCADSERRGPLRTEPATKRRVNRTWLSVARCSLMANNRS